MCVCNGSEDIHCRWHRRIIHLYEQATALTDSDLFTPAEVLASLKDAESNGELPE